MKIIDALGMMCPVPVIEAKKVLAEQDSEGVIIKVDNIAAVQNLEKMAKGYRYNFSYKEREKNLFEIIINKDVNNTQISVESNAAADNITVIIGKDRMGEGAEELGKILIKGFIYSLSELDLPPKYIIFLNSGAYLTSDSSNTLDDLKILEQKGTKILTCGTCINYYGLQDRLAVGAIANMYEITEKMAEVLKIINI